MAARVSGEVPILIERLIREAFDASFWKAVSVVRVEGDAGVYFHLMGLVDEKALRASILESQGELGKRMVPKHAAQIVARLSRQRWVGPYRWRK